MNLAIQAAAIRPHATGATAQTQALARAQGQAQAFQAQSHPRGADGKFINTGGTVQILQNGKAVAEGQVVSTGVTAQGPVVEVRNPTTGQTTTVPTSAVKQAPLPIATLSKPGTQGIPTGPGAAARAARYDALHGIRPRSGVDALGQKSNALATKQYLAAYRAEQAHLAKIAAHKATTAKKKAAAAAKKKAAAAKKKAAAKKPGLSQAYTPDLG